jgi:hypothetical protein
MANTEYRHIRQDWMPWKLTVTCHRPRFGFFFWIPDQDEISELLFGIF